MATYTVTLEKIVKEFNLEVLYTPDDVSEIKIHSADVNRPGLQLACFIDVFDNARIQIMGKTEFAYLEQFDDDRIQRKCDMFFGLKPAAAIITRDLQVYPQMIVSAEKFGVPLLTTVDGTSTFMSSLIAYLNVELAPRITRHGVLVEVYGEGIMLFGESGVGKSETAIELIKRGHRLIADDAVEIRKVSSKTLVGTSPENIRHFLELRGIGIINARRIFGMGAIKVTEKIDMIIQLEQWDQAKVYDRMGLESEYTEILGIQIPCTTIPVKPGRNLAVIIEVAAMNHRQKKMGYNAAQELMQKLGMSDGGDEVIDWDQY